MNKKNWERRDEKSMFSRLEYFSLGDSICSEVLEAEPFLNGNLNFAYMASVLSKISAYRFHPYYPTLTCTSSTTASLSQAKTPS